MDEMGLINSEEECRSLAIRIVSDIALYNPVKVREGICRDSIFEVLKQEIEDGRSFYERKISSFLLENTNFFNQAICDILIKPNANLKSAIW